MEQDFFLDAVSDLAQYAHRKGFEELHCVWLGGEPLLAGIPFFERVAAQTAALSPQIPLRHFVQTNGLLLDDAFCRFFKDAHIHLGVSLDGPQDIHDAFRKTPDGQPTHGRVLESLALLRRHGVDFGCAAVVTPKTLGRESEVYDFFRNLGCGFRVNPQIPGPRIPGPQIPGPKIPGPPILGSQSCGSRNSGILGADPACHMDPEDYGPCLVRFFNAWSLPGPDRVNISPLDNYVRAVVTGKPSECQHQPNCAANSVGIKANGDVTLCGRFQGAAMGNLRRSSLSHLLALRESEPSRAERPLLAGCRACDHWRLCHGGCPHNAFAFGRAPLEKDPFCKAYKTIFAHIQEALHP